MAKIGKILVVGLLFAGLFLSFILGFPQITKIGKAFKLVFGGLFKKKEGPKEEGSMSSFQALATAVAAQVGTGNVAGVATAITAGGPGAIFWMWLSAFFGMGTIFVEAVLAQKYRSKIDGEFVGGPAYYISKGLKKTGVFAKILAGFFAIAIVLALGFMGNAVQSNSIASGIKGIQGLENINPAIIGVVIAILAALIFIGGIDRIAKFAELVVPVMAVVYILGSIVILIMFAGQVGPTFAWIFKSAFNGTAAMGGIAGAAVKVAVQKGVARGLFSNEAGMGSAAITAAAATTDNPVRQGYINMTGTFWDTIVVCSITGLTIASSGVLGTTDASGAPLKGIALTMAAFSSNIGVIGTYIVAIGIILFAFSTILGWEYNGEKAWEYLFGTHKYNIIYRVAFSLVVFVGATQTLDLVWNLSDIANALMAIPNLISLLVLSPVIKEEVVRFQGVLAKERAEKAALAAKEEGAKAHI